MTIESIEAAITATVAAIPVVISAAAAAMAVLPQGAPGSTWDKIRTFVNFLAMNWGHAKNVQEHQ